MPAPGGDNASIMSRDTTGSPAPSRSTFTKGPSFTLDTFAVGGTQSGAFSALSALSTHDADNSIEQRLHCQGLYRGPFGQRDAPQPPLGPRWGRKVANIRLVNDPDTNRNP